MDLFKKVWDSFIYAAKGIVYGFYTRKNMGVFLSVAIIVALLLIWLGTSKIKFTIIMVSWMLVIILEITNTAIEKIIDTLHPGFNEGMGRAKDMMAGAVLIAIFTASVVTVLMIWDPLTAKLLSVSAGLRGGK
jgi:diacylglycerol kinase (ATP)